MSARNQRERHLEASERVTELERVIRLARAEILADQPDHTANHPKCLGCRVFSILHSVEKDLD